MIRHTYLRPPGGARYASTERAAARRAMAAGDPDTVTPDALAAMVAADGIRPVVDVLFELESNRLGRPVATRLLVDDVETAPTSGDLAILTNGRRVDTPVVFAGVTVGQLGAVDAVVELTWSTVRRVNTVEVHGVEGGQITDATVEVATAAGGPWVEVGGESSPAGRLAVRFPETWGYGVRVHVDGAAGAAGDPVRVVEVDPMFVRDVSDDVVGVEVAWSRESDPGQSADPTGTYEASEVTIELDDTDGRWNPATNTTLDVGHRVEVAFGVAYPDGGGDDVEELFPAGVFYTEPFDTESDATTVQITGTDRLGRAAGDTVTDPVLVDSTVGDAVRGLAAKYLDLDGDQVVVAPSIADLVFPYLYPSGDLGSYLADIAVATGATLHVDALDRLVVARRADVDDTPVALVTDSTSLSGFRRPPGYDVTTSAVEVTAAPLVLDVEGDLWGMPPGGITVPVGGEHVLIGRYESPPGLNQTVSGVFADGAYTLTKVEHYADRSEVTIRNDEPALPLVVADLRIRGNPLVEASLTARAEHAPSVLRYGPRTLQVTARLAQTQTQVELIAAVLLDAFRSIDDVGIRRLPDVTFDGVGLLHLAAGDRVTLAWPDKGLGGDYTILGRRLAWRDGAFRSSEVRVRESPSETVYMVADRGLLTDDGVVAGY